MYYLTAGFAQSTEQSLVLGTFCAISHQCLVHSSAAPTLKFARRSSQHRNLPEQPVGCPTWWIRLRVTYSVRGGVYFYGRLLIVGFSSPGFISPEHWILIASKSDRASEQRRSTCVRSVASQAPCSAAPAGRALFGWRFELLEALWLIVNQWMTDFKSLRERTESGCF